MDKITQQTLRQLDQVEKELRNCQARLKKIGRARVPVYFSVPSKANYGFETLYTALDDMRHILQNHPEKIEG